MIRGRKRALKNLGGRRDSLPPNTKEQVSIFPVRTIYVGAFSGPFKDITYIVH